MSLGSADRLAVSPSVIGPESFTGRPVFPFGAGAWRASGFPELPRPCGTGCLRDSGEVAPSAPRSRSGSLPHRVSGRSEFTRFVVLCDGGPAHRPDDLLKGPRPTPHVRRADPRGSPPPPA